MTKPLTESRRNAAPSSKIQTPITCLKFFPRTKRLRKAFRKRPETAEPGTPPDSQRKSPSRLSETDRRPGAAARNRKKLWRPVQFFRWKRILSISPAKQSRHLSPCKTAGAASYPAAFRRLQGNFPSIKKNIRICFPNKARIQTCLLWNPRPS